MEMNAHASKYFQNLMKRFHSCTQEISFLKFDITRRLKVTDPEAYFSSNIGVPFKSGEVMLGEQAFLCKMAGPLPQHAGQNARLIAHKEYHKADFN